MTVSTLTLLVLRIGFLLLLWVFVFSIVYALRSDIFGARTRKGAADASRAPFAGVPTAAPAPLSPRGHAAVAIQPVTTPTSPANAEHPLAGLARDLTGPIQQPVAASSTETEAVQGPPTGARPNRPMATLLTATRLVITSGPRSGTEIALGNDPVTIGRSSESDLVIRDDYTSTHHARLMLWNNEWMLQDLDSTNGTFLDGQRVIVPTQVPLDAPIKIGTTTFELRR